MTTKSYRLLYILIFMVMTCTVGHTAQPDNANDKETLLPDKKEGRSLHPHIEYTNEWQPVGRGDPLKDPTYDYMPPVLDRVRYWGEGASQKNKNDILLLGVASKKLSNVNQRDKLNYGPIKRTYYSQPYQHHFSSPLHQQQQHQQQHQQQYLPQRLMPPPPKHVDSYRPSSHHFQHYQQHHGMKTSNNIYSEPRPENSINHVILSRPNMTHPSVGHFLPTASPFDRSREPSSTSPTLLMSTKTTVVHNGPTINGHMMPSRTEYTETTKPLLQTILQTETAAPFTKKPSNVYQIEYTSSIYNPEAINSMATSSSIATTFISTKPTVRPMAIQSSMKTNVATPTSVPTITEEEKHYVQPDMQFRWPVYNLVIEGHSKVKNYGSKNDDVLGNKLPMIRPVQASENPIVDRVTNAVEGPEFNEKHLKLKKKDSQQLLKSTDDKNKSTMSDLLSLLGSSFDNFLSDENADKMHEESEKRIEKTKKTRRSVPDAANNKNDRVLSVSYQVEAGKRHERPQTYRKGTVISEQLWPSSTTDDTSMDSVV